MTWNEFKQYIDTELNKQDMHGNIQIGYIDISFPDLDHASTTPNIGIDDAGMSIF